MGIKYVMKVKLGKQIVADSDICHGKPTFAGTRILVSDIIELVAEGYSSKEIISQFPSLKKEMIQEALWYSARVISGERYAGFAKIPA